MQGAQIKLLAISSFTCPMKALRRCVAVIGIDGPFTWLGMFWVFAEESGLATIRNLVVLKFVKLAALGFPP